MEQIDDTLPIITHYLGVMDVIDGVYREIHGTGYARQAVQMIYANIPMFLYGPQVAFRVGKDWKGRWAGTGVFDKPSGGTLLLVFPCKDRIPLQWISQINGGVDPPNPERSAVQENRVLSWLSHLFRRGKQS